MRRMQIVGGWWGLAAISLATALSRPAAAIYLDEAQNFQLRARAYSRFSVRLEDSDSPKPVVNPGDDPGGDTVPAVKTGQMVEHRNFYNPEFEGKLAPYLPAWLRPDDFSFRFAAWGFYDGIYDYGPRQFHDTARKINADWPDPTQRNAFQLEGPDFRPSQRSNGMGGMRQPTIQELFSGVEVQNARDIYASRRRINELYLNYSNGPVFVRIGKQAISWGESDTIALLDQNNPFDVTLAAPGLFQAIDEARIPLWTVRTSVTLFESLGPFSSGFVEAYWVPGDLDVNTGILPLQTGSPYSNPGRDPQETVNAVAGPLLQAQFVLFDHIPKKRFESSRYGFRAQTVLNRFFTLSGWMYTTYPNTPTALSQGLVRVDGTPIRLFVTETVHNQLVSVWGLSNTFFLEPLDSIMRLEAEYFDNEPGFTAEDNLGVNQATASGAGALGVLTNCSNGKCAVPKADFLRWEVGLDRFFFFRPLNPSNSFLLATAVVGSWNMDEGRQRDHYTGCLATDATGACTTPDPRGGRLDFRYYGLRKPGKVGNSPDDFVQLKRVEAFAQAHLQTDYMHGRLSPGVTVIGNVRGTYAVNPTLTYRMSDWLLFDLSLIHIGGEFQQLGFFRDRDQISAAATLQLN